MTANERNSAPRHKRKPRQTRIRLDRFRPTSTGYRFLSEGSSSDA